MAARIEVLLPGLLTTVQDLGRRGWAHLGVSAAGAADPLSLRAGNLLVGNPEGAPALEMTLMGGTFRFEGGALVAAAGSDFGVPPYEAFEVRAGDTLRFGLTRGGARCYLCVRGGIAAPRLMGSASTDLVAGFGGLGGRALARGDVLEIGPAPESSPRRLAPAPDLRGGVVRVLAGPHRGWFSDGFFRSSYEVTEESNRMGLRLRGVPLEGSRQIVTRGVIAGTVQVPPEGQPIVLFVDQQTTGGYPQIAFAIAADLPVLGQLRPRDRVSFEVVTREQAVAALREQEAWLGSPGLIGES